jgi:hypothetical protein
MDGVFNDRPQEGCFIGGLSRKERVYARVEGKPAMDGLDDFYARFPDAARIHIDNSGIQPRRRATSHSDAAGAKSFYDMFPGAARIKLA